MRTKRLKLRSKRRKFSVVAMIEMVWVLERAYRLAEHETAAATERVLQADVLVVENEEGVFYAMIALKEKWGSFADALLAALDAGADCSHTFTFDHKALRLPRFILL